MLHDRISNLDAARAHLMSESRTFPNPGFDKLLEDARWEDLVWLDGAMSDQLEGLEHYVADPQTRKEMFVQISDRLALVRHFAAMRADTNRHVNRYARLWSVLAVTLLGGVMLAGTVVASVD